MSASPSAVLFACNLNRVRSPMAEALARRVGGAGLIADSCGIVASEGIDPFVFAAMAELGIDLADHRPKTFEALDLGAYDRVISLTPEAHDRAVALARGRAMEVEFWPIADPTLAMGSREQQMQAYRDVRADLERRLRQRFG